MATTPDLPITLLARWDGLPTRRLALGAPTETAFSPFAQPQPARSAR